MPERFTWQSSRSANAIGGEVGWDSENASLWDAVSSNLAAGEMASVLYRDVASEVGQWNNSAKRRDPQNFRWN